jgi:hypothetical protein
MKLTDINRIEDEKKSFIQNEENKRPVQTLNIIDDNKTIGNFSSSPKKEKSNISEVPINSKVIIII